MDNPSVGCDYDTTVATEYRNFEMCAASDLFNYLKIYKFMETCPEDKMHDSFLSMPPVRTFLALVNIFHVTLNTCECVCNNHSIKIKTETISEFFVKISNTKLHGNLASSKSVLLLVL